MGAANLTTPLRRGFFLLAPSQALFRKCDIKPPATSLKGRRDHPNLPTQDGIKRAEQRLLRMLA